MQKTALWLGGGAQGRLLWQIQLQTVPKCLRRLRRALAALGGQR